MAEFCLNKSVNEATSKSAFFLMYGEHPQHPAGLLSGTLEPGLSNESANQFVQRMSGELREAKEHMVQHRDRMKRMVDQRRKLREFQVGDKVLLSTQDLVYAQLGPSAKLKQRWTGPFDILRKIGELAYEVDIPLGWKVHRVFNVDRLKLGWRLMKDLGIGN